MDNKISNLNEALTVFDEDVLPIVSNVQTKKVTVLTLIRTPLSLKADKVLNKSLISDSEITRLANVNNFDNSNNVNVLNSKVDKVANKSLILDTEINRLSSVTNFDNNANVSALSAKVDKVTNKSLVLDSETLRLATVTNFDNSGNVTALNTKQSTLNSGTNIKTINGASILGAGDIVISGGVVPNTAIVGATKTKITYDAKGLVTAGADATTADIADSTNKRYVTDAQLTAINSNSGDNATNTQYSGLQGSKVDKGVNNATTVVLTTAQLNSQYPSAGTSFRVYCTSIIAGSMVYEKTPTQWIGTTVFTP